MARSYSGKVYRALNPIYAREPLSGEGARRYGGRFNPRGTSALYCSLSIMTAVREANQVGTLQPTTLVAYEAEIDNIFDATDEAALRDEGMDAAALAASNLARRDASKRGSAEPNLCPLANRERIQRPAPFAASRWAPRGGI